jgi:hypothetical protein
MIKPLLPGVEREMVRDPAKLDVEEFADSLKADTVGCASITSFHESKKKLKSSMLSLQRNPEIFQKPSLRYAA